jgi:hypothetical protein
MIVNTSDSNYVRDTTSNAVINTNTTAYKLYKQQRASAQRAESMANEVELLKQQVALLSQLIEQRIQK